MSWISTDERLPELNVLVWVQTKDEVTLAKRKKVAFGVLWHFAIHVPYYDTKLKRLDSDCLFIDTTPEKWHELPQVTK